MDVLFDHPDLGVFFTQLVVCLLFFLAYFLLFCYYREKKIYIYTPKLHFGRLQERIKELPKGFLSWILPLLVVPDKRYIKTAGPDGYMYLYNLELNIIIFIAISCLSLAVLVPIYYFNGANGKGLDKLSINNIQVGSNSVYLESIFALLYSVSVIASNYVFAKEAIKIRQWYLKNKVEKLKDGLYPVLVSGLPNERGTELTMADLAANNVDDVDDVYMLKSAIEIETFTEMRDIVQEKLENALTSVARDEFKYRKDNPEKNDFSIRSDRLREISVLAESIVDINTDIKTEIDNLYAQQNTMSAVIVFRNIASAHKFVMKKSHILGRETLSHMRYTDSSSHAINWRNLNVTYRELLTKRHIGTIVCVLLILFWSIPTSFVSGLASLYSLQNLGAFSFVKKLPAIIRWGIEGLVPTFVMYYFSQILPFMLRAIIKYERHPLMLNIEKRLVDKYFAYLIFNVFFVYLVSGTIWLTVTSLHKNINVGLTKLVYGAIENSQFFILYIMISAFYSSGSSLFQSVNIIFSSLKKSPKTRTPREEMRMREPRGFSMGMSIPTVSFIFFLGMIYSVVCPLVPFVALIYFGLHLVVTKYNFMYVMNPKSFNIGGRYAIKMLAHKWFSLYVFQLMMIFWAIGKSELTLAGIIGKAIILVIGLVLTGFSHSYMKKNLYPRIKYSEAACPKLPEHLRKIPLVKRYVSSMAARKKDTGMFSVDVEDILRTKDSPISEDKFEKEDAKAIANPAYQDCCCTEIWVPKTDLPVTSDLYGELDKKMITLGNINCSDVAFNDDGSLELNRTTYP